MLLVAATVAMLLPATAQAADSLPSVLPRDVLTASPAEVGMIGLAYGAPLGTRVDFYERVRDRLKPLGMATVSASRPLVAVFPGAVRWRCDRAVRRFEARAIAPDGSSGQDSVDVRTPSCASRLRLSVPRRVALGGLVRVRVKDAWRNGAIKPRLCITAPRAASACRALAFPRTVAIAGRQFRPTKRGLWRVELRFGGHRVRGAVAVGGARYVSTTRLPTVLATGNSLMVGLDSFLGDRLAATATVLGFAQVGTALGQDLGPLRRAAALARKYRPRTTVVIMGEPGYPMRAPDGTMRTCCDALWAAEYSRRARLTMKAYIRNGRGHVLWLTVPTPRNPELAAVTGVVNLALQHAAEGLTGARILRLDLVLTPNGYRESMPYRGQTVRVRQTDGLHLTATGAAIAAEAVEKALRAAPGWLSAAAN